MLLVRLTQDWSHVCEVQHAAFTCFEKERLRGAVGMCAFLKKNETEICIRVCPLVVSWLSLYSKLQSSCEWRTCVLNVRHVFYVFTSNNVLTDRSWTGGP